jgi:hypothetical protein
MKTLLCTLILATLGTTLAKADDITVTFDQPTQFAVPGQTIQFLGTIVNDDATTIFLNGTSFTLAGQSFTIDDQFLNTVPISLAPEGQAGDSSGDIELFDVTASAPLLDAPALYSGSYTLLGGPGGSDQENLGSTSFSVDTAPSVTPVPEPSTIYLLLGGLSTVVPISRKLRAQAA